MLMAMVREPSRKVSRMASGLSETLQCCPVTVRDHDSKGRTLRRWSASPTTIQCVLSTGSRGLGIGRSKKFGIINVCFSSLFSCLSLLMRSSVLVLTKQVISWAHKWIET